MAEKNPQPESKSKQIEERVGFRKTDRNKLYYWISIIFMFASGIFYLVIASIKAIVTYNPEGKLNFVSIIVEIVYQLFLNPELSIGIAFIVFSIFLRIFLQAFLDREDKKIMIKILLPLLFVNIIIFLQAIVILFLIL